MRNRIQVRASCPRCGPILVDGGVLQCEREPGAPSASRGLCELTCPSCSQAVLFPTGPAVTQALFEGGAKHPSGAVPFELLEPHTGPPLSWDELLDFQLALARSPRPQLELEA